MSGRHREQALLPQGFWGAYKSAAECKSHCGSELARDSGVAGIGLSLLQRVMGLQRAQGVDIRRAGIQ